MEYSFKKNLADNELEDLSIADLELLSERAASLAEEKKRIRDARLQKAKLEEALRCGRVVLIACPGCRGSGDGCDGCASDNMDMHVPGGCHECGGSGKMYAVTPEGEKEDWYLPGILVSFF